MRDIPPLPRERNPLSSRWKPAGALDPVAHALSTSVPYLLGFAENSSEVRSAVPYFLSLPEEKLIQLFRKVPEEDRPLVLGMIQAALNSKGLL